jgi:hypothetical protein
MNRLLGEHQTLINSGSCKGNTAINTFDTIDNIIVGRVPDIDDIIVSQGEFVPALMFKRSIAQGTVLFFGLTLVGIAGVDVYLLQSLAAFAKLSASFVDDAFFSSELSLALYLLPALFGGIGINLVSHVLVNHLVQAETRFKSEHSDTVE